MMITSIEIQAIKDAMDLIPEEDKGIMAKNCLRLIERIEGDEKVLNEFRDTVEDLRKGIEIRNSEIKELKKQLEFAMIAVNKIGCI